MSATITAPVATISGQVDLSMQLLAQAAPEMDQVLAKELGTLIGQALDLQILNGTGLNGQMAGLLVVSGTTAVTSTTVTAIANIATIGKGYDLAGVAGGVAADTMVAHPRRVGYIATTLGYSPAPYPPGITEIIEAPAMPTTLSTNSDAIVLYPRSEVILLLGPLNIQVAPQVGWATLTARVNARIATPPCSCATSPPSPSSRVRGWRSRATRSDGRARDARQAASRDQATRHRDPRGAGPRGGAGRAVRRRPAC